MIVWEYFIVEIPIQKALNIRNRKSGHCEEGEKLPWNETESSEFKWIRWNLQWNRRNDHQNSLQIAQLRKAESK